MHKSVLEKNDVKFFLPHKEENVKYNPVLRVEDDKEIKWGDTLKFNIDLSDSTLKELLLILILPKLPTDFRYPRLAQSICFQTIKIYKRIKKGEEKIKETWEMIFGKSGQHDRAFFERKEPSDENLDDDLIECLEFYSDMYYAINDKIDYSVVNDEGGLTCCLPLKFDFDYMIHMLNGISKHTKINFDKQFECHIKLKPHINHVALIRNRNTNMDEVNKCKLDIQMIGKHDLDEKLPTTLKQLELSLISTFNDKNKHGHVNELRVLNMLHNYNGDDFKQIVALHKLEENEKSKKVIFAENKDFTLYLKIYAKDYEEPCTTNENNLVFKILEGNLTVNDHHYVGCLDMTREDFIKEINEKHKLKKELKKEDPDELKDGKNFIPLYDPIRKVGDIVHTIPNIIYHTINNDTDNIVVTLEIMYTYNRSSPFSLG